MAFNSFSIYKNKWNLGENPILSEPSFVSSFDLYFWSISLMSSEWNCTFTFWWNYIVNGIYLLYVHDNYFIDQFNGKYLDVEIQFNELCLFELRSEGILWSIWIARLLLSFVFLLSLGTYCSQLFISLNCYCLH